MVVVSHWCCFQITSLHVAFLTGQLKTVQFSLKVIVLQRKGDFSGSLPETLRMHFLTRPLSNWPITAQYWVRWLIIDQWQARTVVRSGGLNFDWDEKFQLDLLNNMEVEFLIYSWDPQLRHRLCYRSETKNNFKIKNISDLFKYFKFVLKIFSIS